MSGKVVTLVKHRSSPFLFAAVWLCVCPKEAFSQTYVQEQSSTGLKIVSGYAMPGLIPKVANGSVTFKSQSTAPASTPPTIETLKILTPKLNVNRGPNAPEISVGFTAPSGGLQSITLSFRSPSGVQFSTTNGTPYGTAPKSGSVVAGGLYNYYINSPNWNIWTEPGLWNVIYLSATDYSGNTTSLSQAQINALLGNSGITVLNSGKPDVAPPTALTAEVLTPTVSISSSLPFVRLTANITDNLSGVVYVWAGASATINGTTQYLTFSSFTPSVKKGSVGLYQPVSFATPGKYTLYYLNMCDAAGNCADYNSDGGSTSLSTLFNNKITITLKP